MGNLLFATVHIEGTRPLLFHRFGAHSIPLTKQERSGVPGNDPEEWRDSFFATHTGQLYLPHTYAFACLRDAAVFTKKGKANLKKFVASTLQITEATLLIADCFVPLKPMLIEQGSAVADSPPVYVHVAGVRNPGSGGRQIRYRLAVAAGWQCTIPLQWDKTIVSRGEMEAVCTDAGRLVGLGDGRSMGFGKFTIRTFAYADSG